MDTSNSTKPIRILTTDGKGKFYEKPYTISNLADNQVLVRSVMTGVCRSDIDMMQGKFDLLPENMHGHEGLGQVVDVGKNITDCKVGDYVATRGEPAYADYYNASVGTYVVVPSADPKYIIEPVACAVNIERVCREELQKRNTGTMLIIGTGFLAKIFHQTLLHLGYNYSIDVWGNANKDYWGDLLTVPTDSYDVIVDIKDTHQLQQVEVNPNALVILVGGKTNPGEYNFANWLWNNVTIKMPSPRAECFHDAMKLSVEMIKNGNINIDNVWSKGYNRDTEWENAFVDAVNRPEGYSRGYIEWH